MKKLIQISLIVFLITSGLSNLSGCGEKYLPVSNERGTESADGEDEYVEPGFEGEPREDAD